MEDDMIYVAVGKEEEERKSTLKWVLKNLKGKTICVLYVHVPAQMITLPNGFESPVSSATGTSIEAFREWEKQKVRRILDGCSQMCSQFRVTYEHVYIEKESITDGIMELICQLGITKLVMGGAANSRYSRKMVTPTSKKANYVLHYSPDYCHIWFLCKGHLIFTRKGVKPLTGEVEQNQLNRVSFSESPFFSPSAESVGSLSPLTPTMYQGSSPTTSIGSTIMNDKLYGQLQQAQREVKESTQKALEESKRRQEAEKEATEAIGQLQTAETELAQSEKELKGTKIRLDKASQELLKASAQILSLESQIENFNLKLRKMEEEIVSSEKLQKKYKKQRDKLQLERNHVLQIAQESSKQVAEGSSRLEVPFFAREYSLLDLEEATNCFDPSLKIGKGGYANVYRGFLNHTEVAIKILNPNNLQSPSEFLKEVDVLSKVRHPNMVTFIGTCPILRGLIYEYLPNGNLHDRLSCKDKTPPLPWQIRIRIATELCSVLNFLHSKQPSSIIHTSLNPRNVLLDANFVCKLSGFGSCHVIPNDVLSVTSVPKGCLPYMDPEFVESRQLSQKTDIYSFGIILLRLLTAKPALGIVKKVQYALQNNDLHNILDPSAGDWPFLRAEQLAHMALRCCRINAQDTPDLSSEVWRILKPNNDPGRSLSSPFQLVSDDQIPSYFLCPILQEIMHDPHFAADGYTYEADAIRVWIEGGHDTSPMTNLKLAHRDLTPNRALRSAIQAWLQEHHRV